MQAWDQVSVTGGEYQGQAGVIQSCEADIATVKLDMLDEPVMIETANLKLLGR